MRPFRFGVSLITPADAGAWRAKCRRAEELGYDVILVPDHLGMPAPFPALVAAAGATRRPRLGTFVLNAGFWNPALLAREVATTDELTGGRLELGLGTGYVQAEHETAGLPFGSPRERVDHLLRTVGELDRLLDPSGLPPGGPAASGRAPEEASAGPGERRRVPLLVGGNGDRMLRLAAERADIAAFTAVRSVPGSTTGRLEPLTAGEIDGRMAAYHRFATARPEPAELNLLVQLVAVTDDPSAAVRPLLARVPRFTEEQMRELPIVLVGTPEEIRAQVRAARERYGFSYLTVLEPHMEDFGKVIAGLRGE
ncbi:TIGR03621 family F420-dependent LLM class oxidoreductase [Streptomyces fructofermentans]|uniref:TIGR03621 family F420-dependent LLM class oxidoreductase n=1 Tax=Streptomyces fructofermentans TaxID=152141 RepID=UPI0034047DE3